ncbi:MAG TPA: hypothetical protein VNZ22_21780, partial [Bacillota bacterium]|nr:hypothetical protein [Bacillota bacterium]
PSGMLPPAGMQPSNAPSGHSNTAPSLSAASKVVQTNASPGSLSHLLPPTPAIPVFTAAPPQLLAAKSSPVPSAKGASMPASPEHQLPLRPYTPLPSSLIKPAKSTPTLTWPLLAGLGVALALLAFLGLRTMRKPPLSSGPALASGSLQPTSPLLAGTLSTAPQTPPPAPLSVTTSHPLRAIASRVVPPTKTSSSSHWQQRALAAEQKAEHAEALLRADLLPQLSQWLKQKLVNKLLTDRTQLLATQQAATLQALQVHERLTRIETQIQQQQQAYEHRIDALTRELTAAKEENRQLIRAQIDQVKAEMEAARSRMRASAQEKVPAS